MNKIYIGENEIYNGINDSSFVDVSTFDAHEKVIASAITYIDASVKALDASIKQIAASGGSDSGGAGSSFDPTEINSSISDISTRVHNIESNYLVADDISIYYTKSQINASFGDVDYALNNISDDIEHLDTNKAEKTEVYTRNWIDTSINSLNTRIVDVSSYAQDVSARMPIFEYNSATQTLNIIA